MNKKDRFGFDPTGRSSGSLARRPHLSRRMLFRHAALLDGNGDATLTLDQAETLVEAAIDECERFYPVFQFVLWADKSPSEAIAAALIETQGEA